MHPITFHPAASSLGHDAPLDYRVQVPLLGLPLTVCSNSPSVIAAAERSFGHWRNLAADLVDAVAPLRVQVIVGHADPEIGSSGQPMPFVQRAYDEVFIAADSSNLMTAQMDRGVALAFVTPELVANDLHFRHHVLECLALLLASWRDRTPVHAGAVVRNGRAVLLVGHSMVGKSTLCYACLRAGFHLLAEDVVYVSLRQGVRLWGNAARIHLLPDARGLFAELADVPAQIQANGKYKLAVDLTTTGAERLRLCADQAVICLLQRHDGPASMLTPIDADEVIATLCRKLEAGFDLHQARMPDIAATLARNGAYRLVVGRNLADTVALLERVTEYH